jgi:(2Fe-2S) ferredoxin
VTDDAPQPEGGTCCDGWPCHHGCITGCWRVAYAGPVSGVYPDDVWPTAVRRRFGTVVQEASVGDAGAAHWGTRSQRVLDFLRGFVVEHGYPPSMAQIGAAVGLTSTSSVAHQLQVLETRGYIRRVPGQPRAITILDRPEGD